MYAAKNGRASGVAGTNDTDIEWLHPVSDKTFPRFHLELNWTTLFMLANIVTVHSEQFFSTIQLNYSHCLKIH